VDNHDMYRPPMHKFLSHFQAEHRDNNMNESATLFTEVCDLIVSEAGIDVFRHKGVVKRNLLETVFVVLGICIKNNYSPNDVRGGIDKFTELVENNAQLRSATTSSAVIRERIHLALDIFRGGHEF
ncbi:MAG: hypothetical protein QM500_09295, partial [Methylococcales bacterium]